MSYNQIHHLRVSRESKLALEGGRPVRTRSWPAYDKGDVNVGHAEKIAATRVVESKRLFRYDDRDYHSTEVGAFESELCSFFDTKYALACTSGTTALALSLFALGIKAGDRVACPAFTFAATPSAIILVGATPVFIEVNENLHIDLIDLRRHLEEGLSAVVAVHMRGLACDICGVVELADAFGVPVVEDAVPALGVKIKDKRVGTFGKLGAFSTQSDKNINTGEGGFVLTSDEDLYAKAVVMSGAYEGRVRRHGIKFPNSACDLDFPLFGFRMDEIRAAVARSQLQSVPERTRIFRKNYMYVCSKINEMEEIKIRQPANKEAFLGESLIISFPSFEAQKTNWIVRALCAEGIDARDFGDEVNPNVRCFWNWKFIPEFRNEKLLHRHLSKSRGLISSYIDIGLSVTLTERDCDDLIEALTKIIEYQRELKKQGVD